MSVFHHRAGSQARYINGLRRHVKGAYDRIFPFIFTALFGVVLSMFTCDRRAAAGGTGGLHPDKVWWLLALGGISLLWWSAWRYVVSRQKRIGTLYVISALHPDAPVKEFARGAIGRAFHRVRTMPGFKVRFEPDPGCDELNFAKEVGQLAQDLVYALGDDDRASTDNFLVNGNWWAGWGLGAHLADPMDRNSGMNASLGPKMYQWHAPASNRPEGKRPGEKICVGGEGVWAADVFELNAWLAGLSTHRWWYERAVDPGTAHWEIKLARSGSRFPLDQGTAIAGDELACLHFDWPAATEKPERLVLIELGPVSLTKGANPKEFFTREFSGVSDFLTGIGAEDHPFGRLVAERDITSVSWLTWRWDKDRTYRPLALEHFEQAALAVVEEIQRLLHQDDGSGVLVLASIPEAMQIPIGLGLEAVCRRPGTAGSRGPVSLQRLRFAAFDQGSGTYHLVRLADERRKDQGDPQPGPAEIINMTQHTIRILDESGIVIFESPPSGAAAALSETILEAPPLTMPDGTEIGVARVRHGRAADLPPPVPGRALIVSRLTAVATPGRPDLYFPADEVRDEQGRIIGCRRLGRVHDLDDV